MVILIALKKFIRYILQNKLINNIWWTKMEDFVNEIWYILKYFIYVIYPYLYCIFSKCNIRWSRSKNKLLLWRKYLLSVRWVRGNAISLCWFSLTLNSHKHLFHADPLFFLYKPEESLVLWTNKVEHIAFSKRFAHYIYK